jgi:hypothetical protein
MTITADIATTERLATSFNRCLETSEDHDNVISDDAFFDLLPPMWRFQVQGKDALQAQLRAINAPYSEVRSRIVRVVPTAEGFLLEQEETAKGEHTEVARKVWICSVRDGQIVEATCYCNGGWDDELRARHAAEAPMLRP